MNRCRFFARFSCCCVVAVALDTEIMFGNKMVLYIGIVLDLMEVIVRVD